MRRPPDAKGERCTSASPTSSSLASLPRPPQRPRIAIVPRAPGGIPASPLRMPWGASGAVVGA
eukprot:4881794-Alexandrium_andersonii.AAC.1